MTWKLFYSGWEKYPASYCSTKRIFIISKIRLFLVVNTGQPCVKAEHREYSFISQTSKSELRSRHHQQTASNSIFSYSRQKAYRASSYQPSPSSIEHRRHMTKMQTLYLLLFRFSWPFQRHNRSAGVKSNKTDIFAGADTSNCRLSLSISPYLHNRAVYFCLPNAHINIMAEANVTTIRARPSQFSIEQEIPRTFIMVNLTTSLYGEILLTKETGWENVPLSNIIVLETEQRRVMLENGDFRNPLFPFAKQKM